LLAWYTNFAIQNTSVNHMTIAGTASNAVLVSNIVRDTSQKTITDTDSPYAVTTNDDILFCDSSSGSVTVNLPAVATARQHIVTLIRTSASNSVTIDPNASETINGASTYSAWVSARDSIRIIHDTNEWFII
jgi:hypothetical protein